MNIIHVLKKNRNWVVGGVLAVLIIIVSLLLVSVSMDTTNKLQVWRPSVLPNGVSITDEDYKHVSDPTIGESYYEYSFILSDDSRIFERSYPHGSRPVTPCSRWGGETTCKEYKASNGLTYNVVITSNNNVPFSIVIDGNNATTHFYYAVSDEKVKEYLDYDWSRMMNSLQKVDISHLTPAEVRSVQGSN